ncbi:MAG: autotransporter-associated beta strand repeat-containing protein [Verrucomicrobia bacterium]|nr:autotransporter-associated beta strand repeat-containing protein [Verrucomicrobiota bacterium]
MQIPTSAGFRLKKDTLKVLTEHVNRYLRAHGLVKGRARLALFSLTLVFGHAAYAQSEGDLNSALGSSGSSWLTLSSPSLTLSSPLSVQNGGSVTVSGTANQPTLNGNGTSGFFVQSGQLTLSNLTLTNFSTVGGTGSGGGAGLGGALFVNTGASATLNGVNFYANTVTGGTGGVGTKGGSLNNLFNNGPNNGSDGANGADAPTNSSYSNGGNGSNGWPGASGGNGNPGTGGNGGNGGKGSVGTVASADTVFAAAEIAFHTAQAAVADAQAAAATAEAAASAAEAAGHADEAAADTLEAADDTAEATGLTAEAAGEVGAEAEFTDAAAATAAAVGSAAGAVEEGLKAGEDGDKAVAEGTDAAADGTEATEESAQAAKFSQQAAKETAEAEAGAAYLLALTETSEYNGTSGIGGLGGDGGQGGNGSFGNGGGRGGSGGDGGNAGSQVGTTYAVGGNGGNGANAGAGGFGAGGGAGGNGGKGGQNPDDNGDHGSENGTDGVGGNGGSAGFGGGQGMTGQGYQFASGGGDGGSGYGGAIFVAANGTLTITGTATFDGNNAVGGISDNGQNGGNAGQAAGTDLFMMTGANVTLAPGAGNTITFNGTIADDSASSIGGTSIPVGSGAGITIADGGTVIFNGQDTYSGQTKIEGGALQAQDGTGLPSNSNLNLAGGVFQSSGTFTRFLGTNSNRVQWTNSGGFAAVDGGLTVRLNAGQTLTWGSGSFVPKGDALLFGSESATDNVLFKNNLDLGGQNESILVTANSDNSDTATIYGVISDGSLTVNDSNHTGTLILTGANTYTGGTTINNGTLVLGKGGSLAATGAVVDNGTFDISQSANQTIGDLSGSGTVDLGAHKLTAGTANSTTFSGTLVDGGLGGGTGGSLVKQGTGTLTLTGANTFTGGTTVSAGTLALSGSGSLAATGAVVDNATFDISQGGNQTIGDLSGSGTVNLGGQQLTEGTASNTNFSGTIQDGGLGGGTGGSLVKQGTGTLTLTGANTYTGGTTVNAGTVALSGSGSLAATGAVIDHATFDISQGGNQTIGDLSGSGTVKLGGRQLTEGTPNSTAFTGTIQDGGLGGGTGGSLVKQGSGALVLAGANSYTGGTTISAGALILAGGGSLAATGAVVDNATFDISGGGNQTIGDLSGSGTVQLGGQQLTEGTANSTAFTGTIQDGGIAGGTGGSLVKQGAGTLTLTAANSYTGGTTISAGALVVTGGSLAAAGAVVDNAVLDISGSANQTIGDLSGSGTVKLGGRQLTTGTVNSTTFSGSLVDGGSRAAAAAAWSSKARAR